MFNSLRLHQIVSACRDSVIGIQSDQLSLHKKVEASEKQVEFFNDELVKHDENWVKVIGRMRKVWKNMKSEFAVTRTTVQSLHKRVGIMEKRQGYVSANYDQEEQQDDVERLREKLAGVETHLNELVDIVHHRLGKQDHPNKGDVRARQMEGLFRSLEERVNNQSTRLGSLERGVKERHTEHVYTNSDKLRTTGEW